MDQNQDIKIYSFEVLPSTNDFSKTLSGKALVIAESQTKGRGQKDHSFFSPKGGLYFSYSFDTEKPPTEYAGLTLDVGRWMKEILENLSGKELRIMGVNDLYCMGKKVGGILTEYFPKENSNRLIIGTGLNLTTDIELFQKENLPEAGSLGPLDKNALIESLLKTFSTLE